MKTFSCTYGGNTTAKIVGEGFVIGLMFFWSNEGLEDPIEDETHAYRLKGGPHDDTIILTISEITQIPIDEIRLRPASWLP